ncbi:MAG TPA: hypothetical protein VJ851_14290 [Jatrophihabitans sp.]|nr:hypothetical protein [Jatrophihabitans sp.]
MRLPSGSKLFGSPREIGRWVVSGLAFLLVWFALVAPNQLSRFSPAGFVRVPIEGLVILAVGLLNPPRVRWLATVLGGLLGLLTVLKLFDLLLFAVLDRPFNPVTDWGNIQPGIGVVADSVGRFWAGVVIVCVVLLVLGVLVLVTWSVSRLLRLAARHRSASIRTGTALAAVWLVFAVVGVHLAGGSVASTNAFGIADEQFQQVRAGLADQKTFAAAVADDSFRSKPAGNLLTGLRGKDVLVVFVESYGRIAVQGSSFSPAVDDTLRSATSALQATGSSARSAFLTSPTFGGGSWFAHSTLQSGLWIDNQQRYNELVGGDRFTLSDAFKRAGWRTVGDVPANTKDWPQGTSFYHYDKIYDVRNVGYAGPRFSYATMPDQYVLSAFSRLELTPGHRPLMAEIDLVSSHTPWAPLPHLVPWNQIGDGSIYDGMPTQGKSAASVWLHPSAVRAAYGQSIQYSLNSLVSFVQNAHDDNLVMVVLGDHQPSTIVSGNNSGHDVPVSIIARDPAVLDRASSWGWQAGLLPDPQAPVWPMDAFRDRFLTAYGPLPAAAAGPR